MYHMASVMYQAAKAEDTTSQQLEERLAQLEYENRYLREVLSLSTPSSMTSAMSKSTSEEEGGMKEGKSRTEPDVSGGGSGTNSLPKGVGDTPMPSDSDDSRSSTPRNVDESS